MLNYFWIEIKGKNTKRLLVKIFKENINIENIKYEKDRTLLKVSYDSYKKIKQIKTSYEINIIKTSGKLNIIEKYQKYKISLLIFIISIFFVIFMSSFILFINIETDNSNMKNLIKKQLNENGITLFSLKKDYDYLNEVKSKIKAENENSIEWLELSIKGVNLNVKVIERVGNKNKENTELKDIVAEKNGYIRKVYSRKGELLKNIDDYVKKGEIIISGNIHRNDKVVGKVKASGKVYAEVWYIVKLNENLNYSSLEPLNKNTLKLSLKVQNKEITLFKIKTSKESKNRTLFKNDIFTIFLKHEKNYKLKRDKYTEKNLENILKTKAKNEINKTLNKDEYIIKEKTLKKYVKNGRMYVEVFISTYEDIAKEQNIAKIEEEIKEKEE